MLRVLSVLTLSLLTSGCAVVMVAGAAAGAAIAVTGAVVSTGIKATGAVIDAVTPSETKKKPPAP